MEAHGLLSIVYLKVKVLGFSWCRIERLHVKLETQLFYVKIHTIHLVETAIYKLL